MGVSFGVSGSNHYKYRARTPKREAAAILAQFRGFLSTIRAAVRAPACPFLRQVRRRCHAAVRRSHPESTWFSLTRHEPTADCCDAEFIYRR